MKKMTILTIALAIFLLPMVSAWHCEDTDESKPENAYTNQYGGPDWGPWGDNGLLGGKSTGWFDTDVTSLPRGCTGMWDDREGVKAYYNVTCNDYCSDGDLVEFYCDDRPTTSSSTEDGFPWETVIFWHTYKDSDACKEVPEFGTIAAIVAVVGAVAGLVMIRKK